MVARTWPYKAEHTIDAETELILAAEVYEADRSDSQTLADSVMAAVENVKQAGGERQIEEIIADKGYHSAAQLELAQDLGFRTYIPEPKRKGKSRLNQKPIEHQRAVKANRRRTKTKKNKRLQRLRSERVERSFAHVCETGGSRRTWLRGIDKVRKRLLTSAMTRNLGLIMRKLFGFGTPKGLQGDNNLAAILQAAWYAVRQFETHQQCSPSTLRSLTFNHQGRLFPRMSVGSSTGC